MIFLSRYFKTLQPGHQFRPSHYSVEFVVCLCIHFSVTAYYLPRSWVYLLKAIWIIRLLALLHRYRLLPGLLQLSRCSLSLDNLSYTLPDYQVLGFCFSPTTGADFPPSPTS